MTESLQKQVAHPNPHLCSRGALKRFLGFARDFGSGLKRPLSVSTWVAFSVCRHGFVSGHAFTGCGKMQNFRSCARAEAFLPLRSSPDCVSRSTFLGPRDTPRPAHYTAGASSRCIRSKFKAAAAKRNIQSTRLRPRNFVCRRPAPCLIQLKTCSTCLRFFWLGSNPGSFLSVARSQLGHCFDCTAYSATCGTTCRCRNPAMSALPDNLCLLPR